MISIVTQRTIGARLFNILFGSWLSEIYDISITGSSLALFPKFPTNLLPYANLPADRIWTGWWPTDAMTGRILSTNEIKQNECGYLKLDGQFERTDIVPHTYLANFIFSLRSAWPYKNGSLNKFGALIFNKNSFVENCETKVGQAIIDFNINIFKKIVSYYYLVYNIPQVVILRGFSKEEESYILSRWNIDLNFLNDDAAFFEICHGASYIVIPEDSTAWWAAINSNARNIYIRAHPLRNQKCTGIEYSKRYGKLLLTTPKVNALINQSIQICALKL